MPARHILHEFLFGSLLFFCFKLLLPVIKVEIDALTVFRFFDAVEGDGNAVVFLVFAEVGDADFHFHVLFSLEAAPKVVVRIVGVRDELQGFFGLYFLVDISLACALVATAEYDCHAVHRTEVVNDPCHVAFSVVPSPVRVLAHADHEWLFGLYSLRLQEVETFREIPRVISVFGLGIVADEDVSLGCDAADWFFGRTLDVAKDASGCNADAV